MGLSGLVARVVGTRIWLGKYDASHIQNPRTQDTYQAEIQHSFSLYLFPSTSPITPPSSRLCLSLTCGLPVSRARLQDSQSQTSTKSRGARRLTKRGIVRAEPKLGPVSHSIVRKPIQESKIYLSEEYQDLETQLLPVLPPPQSLNQIQWACPCFNCFFCDFLSVGA